MFILAVTSGKRREGIIHQLLFDGMLIPTIDEQG
jgi:hypothetical protein